MNQPSGFGTKPILSGSMSVSHYNTLKQMFLQWKQPFKNSCVRHKIGHTLCHAAKTTFSVNNTAYPWQKPTWFRAKQSWNDGENCVVPLLRLHYKYNVNTIPWRTSIVCCTPWAQTQFKIQCFCTPSIVCNFNTVYFLTGTFSDTLPKSIEIDSWI